MHFLRYRSVVVAKVPLAISISVVRDNKRCRTLHDIKWSYGDFASIFLRVYPDRVGFIIKGLYDMTCICRETTIGLDKLRPEVESFGVKYENRDVKSVTL